MTIKVIGHYAHANDVRVPYKGTPNHSGRFNPEVIVLHDTASGLDMNGPVSWLCNPRAKASAHFVIGRGGEIVQLAPCNVKTWHAGKSSYYGRRNVNNFAVGIEMVNPGWLTSKDGGKTGTFSRGAPTWDATKYGIRQVTDDAHPGHYYWMAYTNEQLEAVIELGRALKEAYPGIKDVVGHWFISPGRKVDPNPLFPMDRVKSLILSGRGPVHIPNAMPNANPSKPDPIQEEVNKTNAEVDEYNDYDATTVADLNLRPWPDSPNRVGVIRQGGRVNIERQSTSQKDGAVWYRVAVAKDEVSRNDKNRPDADGKFRGFVHSGYVRLVD